MDEGKEGHGVNPQEMGLNSPEQEVEGGMEDAAKTPEWLNTEKGEEFITKVFTQLGLPEVEEEYLETGTYTNRQIAEAFDDPMELMALIMQIPGNDPVSKRSILSFAVDLRQSNK